MTGNTEPTVTGTTTATEQIPLTDDMFSFTSAVVEGNAGDYTCTATGLTTEVRTFRLSVGGQSNTGSVIYHTRFSNHFSGCKLSMKLMIARGLIRLMLR